MIDANGGAPKVLVAHENGIFLGDAAWAPEGSRIAFLAQTRVDTTSWGESIYRTTLSVVNADGTGRRVLRDLGREDQSPLGWAHELKWSPYG